MSAAMNRADTSNQSLDLSLGSLASGFLTPARNLRLPSSSTATSSALLSTPSPPNATQFQRRRTDDATPRRRGTGLEDLDDEDGDVLDTPGKEKNWAEGYESATASRSKRSKGAVGKGGVNLTLRDQEKHIDSLKKENFNIKLKVHFLEERLAQLAPDQIDAALKQNINLKIEVQQRGMEVKKLKKLVLELERELERLQRGSGRTRELEEKLDEREREIRELRRRRAVGPDDGALREYEARNAQLEEELENARGLLEENMDEMERLREMVERREDDLPNDERLRRRLEALEAENDNLRSRMQEQDDVLAKNADEKEDLADELEALKLELENERRRREAESVERSQSRAQMLDEREEREAVEEGLNAVRDKLAAVQIELQQREDELDMKQREIEDLVVEHKRIVDQVEDEWRGEANEARGHVEELRDVLEQREAESKDLRLHISELETNTNSLHEKFEAALAHLERESEEKDAEIEAANTEIERLGDQVYNLEDQLEQLKEESSRAREDDAVERERLEGLTTALKERLAHTKAQLEELSELCDAKTREADEFRAHQEELAKHIEKLVAEMQRERAHRERLEGERDKLHREHEDSVRQSKRALDAKDAALQTALNDLARTQTLLEQREADLVAVQSALQGMEKESKKLGETHTTARFSLQLEVDRLRRDTERLEDELARARKELESQEAKGREREGVLDKLHAENRDLSSQVSAQTQARLNVTEKLDSVQASLKTAEAEAASLRAKVAEFEQRLAKDQRTLLTSESQYRDQLTERNTLLLTIYQYMDKILGVDKTTKTHGAAETKPFTNFSVFHDNLISRLKALSQIQLDFAKACKDAESRYTEKLSEMRKQLESRWRQLDKFETSLKTLAEAKGAWRKKLAAKEGEVEALKTTNAELQAVITSSKKPGTTDSMEVRALTARATTAERRLVILQNQIAAHEEKMAAMNERTNVADNKWENRVKEYEARLKQAEEKIKRERQGGKERALELETQAKSYQRQIELAQKRISQLNEILESAGLSGKNTSPART